MKQVLVIEPSVLVQNVIRLILKRINGVEIVVCSTLDRLVANDVSENVCAIVVGAGACEDGVPAESVRLMEGVPCIGYGFRRDWDRLAPLAPRTLIERPFHPNELVNEVSRWIR